MGFEWDPDKRERNVEKHGVDFLIATQGLTEPHLLLRAERRPEPWWIAIGPLPEEYVPVDWSGPLCAVGYTEAVLHGHPLRSHADPVAAGEVVASAREL